MLSFSSCNQGPTESIADNVAALWKLSAHFKFGPQLEDALRDRRVCGVRSEPLQKALLATNNLTLKTAMEKALSMEAAERNSKDLQGKTATVPVHKIATPQHSSCTAYHKSSSTFWGPKTHTSRASQPSSRKSCYRCGKTNHTADRCQHLE